MKPRIPKPRRRPRLPKKPASTLNPAETASRALAAKLINLAAEVLSSFLGVGPITYYGACKRCRLIFASRQDGATLTCPVCRRAMQTSAEPPEPLKRKTITVYDYEDVTRKKIGPK